MRRSGECGSPYSVTDVSRAGTQAAPSPGTHDRPNTSGLTTSWPQSLLNHRQEARIFLRALRRQRPLLAEPLLELRVKEGRLHATVDDVPGQDGVVRAV